jgi:hypothetical protein
MSAVKRRLFNVLAAVSAVLCVATVALWVWGCWFWTCFNWTTTSGALGGCVICSAGDLHVEVLQPPPLDDYRARTCGPRVKVRSLPYAKSAAVREPWGRFDVGREANTYFKRTWVGVPFWAIIGVSAPILTLAVHRHTSKSRVGAGRCVACGYDLRATPERCPECGSAVKPTA